MNIPMLDQSKVKLGRGVKHPTNDQKYGEAVRLSNELRFRPAGNVIKIIVGVSQTVWDEGRLWGFDIETASFNRLMSYFTDNRIKKRSQSLITFVLSVIQWRFPTEFHNDRNKITKLVSVSEFNLIETKTKKEVEYLGTKGYSGTVRLDGSLKRPKNKVVLK